MRVHIKLILALEMHIHTVLCSISELMKSHMDSSPSITTLSCNCQFAYVSPVQVIHAERNSISFRGVHGPA